jgi:RNA polymerase sigma factor (sigma-70 family)
MEDLYGALSEGARPRLLRFVDPQSVDDRLHEIWLIVLEAIRSGELREPGRLMGFVQTVTRRRVAAHIRSAVLRRRRLVEAAAFDPVSRESSPEALLSAREQVEAIGKVLRSLRALDREILVRFYLKEESPPRICQELRISATQFRLHKSRALARCLELANRRRVTPPGRSRSRTA